MYTNEQDNTQSDSGDLSQGLPLITFKKWLEEIRNQPAWRAKADREADYRDGNQLDSEVLRKQQSIGMPPAIEPLIGPAMDDVKGMETQHRTNWKVVPDSDTKDDEVAQALNEKLNKAERKAKADKACSDAFGSQADVGIGWVEVSRDDNPFNYPYRAKFVHRNEISWDMRTKERQGTSDYRYLVRRKWMDKEQAKLMFPDQSELIDQAATGWGNYSYEYNLSREGGRSTGLYGSDAAIPQSYGAVPSSVPGQTSYPQLSASYDAERGASIEEQEWRDIANNRVCLFECWYRVWIRALVMKMPDGRVVEYDGSNEMHMMMVAVGALKPFYAVISKVRLSWWLGPHRLSDDASPYRHNKFPYVPFWGKREDRTGVPFGLIRGMMYMQDNVNATNSKIRWGLSAYRVERTEGAVLDDDDTFRSEVGRLDADVVLNAQEMAKPGARFEVKRDFQLTQQQFQMLIDSREGIKRVSGIAGPANQDNKQSGVALANLAEQATQALADLYDNFREARAEVGELLLSLIIEDMIGQEQTVTVPGNGLQDDKQITLNRKTVHPETGMVYLNNDVERTLLKVDLEEVPHTPSFRSQQLSSFTEVFKSAPEDFQRVLFPQLLSLMDVPNKQQAIDAVKQAGLQPTQEEIQQQIDSAVEAALQKANTDVKTREIALKENIGQAQIKKIMQEGVKIGVDSAFASMQAAEVVAAVPQVAPIADAIMESQGYQNPNPAGVNPNFEQPIAAAPGIGVNPVKNNRTGTQFTPNGNTDPMSPANPVTPGIGERRGIETMRNDSA